MRLRPAQMPLMRIDGRWWHRDDVAVPPPAVRPGAQTGAEQEQRPVDSSLDGTVSMEGEEQL